MWTVQLCPSPSLRTYCTTMSITVTSDLVGKVWEVEGPPRWPPNLTVLCSWLYLGGTLSSAMSVLLLMRLGSYFLGGKALVFQAELYVGLLMFIGYVLFDTQVKHSPVYLQ